MVKSENILKAIAIFSILFFIFSMIIFFNSYNSLNMNTKEKTQLNSLNASLSSLQHNVSLMQQKKANLEQLYTQTIINYNLILQGKNISSSSVEITNLNNQIMVAKQNIAKLQSDIATLKTALGQ